MNYSTGPCYVDNHTDANDVALNILHNSFHNKKYDDWNDIRNAVSVTHVYLYIKESRHFTPQPPCAPCRGAFECVKVYV